MPKDVIYPFALASYGNVLTCEAQGLIYIIGNGICFAMNGILNIYYLCSLRFNMKEKNSLRLSRDSFVYLGVGIEYWHHLQNTQDKQLDFLIIITILFTKCISPASRQGGKGRKASRL